jgi:hypothetical protein
LLARNLGVHGTCVQDWALGNAEVHLGDERERLVGRRVEEGRDLLAQARHVCVRSQFPELLGERRVRGLLPDRDGGQSIRTIRRAVLEREDAGLFEVGVHDDALRGGQEHLLDEYLLLVVTAVAADELQRGSRQRDVEDTGVGGVGEVETDDLAAGCLESKVGFSGDEHDVAEASHRDVRRLRLAEGCDLPVLDQNVVECQGELAVGGRPVVSFGRIDQGVPVQAHFLAVVLADVRVVPVGAGIG